VDGHEGVAILARLLVPEPDRVTDLVDHVAEAAAGREVDELLTALPADRRRAAAARPEGHEVGVGRRAGDEAVARVGLPVRDRVGDARLVRKVRVDREGDLAVRPPAVLAADDHRRLEPSGQDLALALGALRHLVDGAEDDVALEDRQVVDDRVLDRAGGERGALDDRRLPAGSGEQLAVVAAAGLAARTAPA
jgi:hypothetical protein